jgi:CHASE1-domain containing sensor protein
MTSVGAAAQFLSMQMSAEPANKFNVRSLTVYAREAAILTAPIDKQTTHGDKPVALVVAGSTMRSSDQ